MGLKINTEKMRLMRIDRQEVESVKLGQGVFQVVQKFKNLVITVANRST